MKSGFHQFNTYLLLFLLTLASGCQTPSEKKAAEKTKVKPDQEASTMEFFLEVNPDGTDRNHPIEVYRDHPITINVMRTPFVETRDVEAAWVVDVLGGFSIKVQLKRPSGARRLEQATTSYRGQRIAVGSQFGEMRWLAAPRITNTIFNGEFFFTPDATREEAERIVRGLNNVIKEGKKKE
jgi:hypothetical protein